MDDLSALSREELLALNQDVMAQRATAEEGYKARSQAIHRELSLRDGQAKLEAALADLPADVREIVLANIDKEG